MSTERQTYNGWKNWDTWNTYLWLSNDEGTYNVLRRAIRTEDRDEFQTLATNAIKELKNPDGIDFDAVDWKEVYEAFE